MADQDSRASRTRTLILAALARGYCTKENEKKELDSNLCSAMADEVMAFLSESTPSIDWLANVIRINSGDHLNPLGAGALAEKIIEAWRAERD